MITPTPTTVTYRVTLTRERFRGRDCIVARDTNNDWRAYGDAPNTPMTTQKLAEYLFHADEIAATGVDEHGRVFADIIDFAATRRKNEAELPETSGGDSADRLIANSHRKWATTPPVPQVRSVSCMRCGDERKLLPNGKPEDCKNCMAWGRESPNQ